MILNAAYLHGIFIKHLGAFAAPIEDKSPELYSAIINAIGAAAESSQSFLEWFWSDACEYKFNGPNNWQHINDRTITISTAHLHSLFLNRPK